MGQTRQVMFPVEEVWDYDGDHFCMRCLDLQQPQQPDIAMDESDTTWLMQQGTKRRLGTDADSPMDHSASASGSRELAETKVVHNQVPSTWARAVQADWEAAGAVGCFVCSE